MTAPVIELVAKRQEDLQGDRPDYHVYAGSRLAGRIHQNTKTLFGSEIWSWGLQGIVTSMEMGQMHGSAESFEEATTKLRNAFDLWLSWALAVPSSHLSYVAIRRDLHDVGAHSLSMIVLQAEAGKRMAERDPMAASRIAGTITSSAWFDRVPGEITSSTKHQWLVNAARQQKEKPQE